MQKVFVTGGSGFVGSHLIKALVGDGISVMALARSERAASRVRGSGASPVAGDLSDEETLHKGMVGCDTVFHLGSWLPDWDMKTARKVNIEGTRLLLQAARDEGVTRFVYVSGTGVMVGRGNVDHVDETVPRGPPVGVLSASRIQSEALVEAANDSRLATVVVRFPFVWGQGDTFRPVLIRLVKSGRFRWIGDGNQLISTCHVCNAVSGLLLAAMRGRPGHIYWIADPLPISFREFVQEQLAIDGLMAPEQSISKNTALALAAVLSAVSRFLGVKRPPMLTPTVVRFLSQKITVNDAKARSELGYRSLVDWERGLRELKPLGSGSAAWRVEADIQPVPSPQQRKHDHA
jgi:nucleoside-diphosphate-sugar epimerase